MEAALTDESIKALRLRLNMSQVEFSACYHIPLATLRNWEQGRRIPDQTTQAFLYVISQMPNVVGNILSDIST